MQQPAQTGTGTEVLELFTFYMGAALCSIDILKIQEINKLLDWTPVPQAEQYVRGILNLRGQIVTVIDLGYKLGLPPMVLSNKSRNIVVNSMDEQIGLLVERLSDVVQVNPDEVERPPANIGVLQGNFFKGVFKTKDHLVGVLDVEAVLKD
jgi:purine-binding chemotaxis protein CheW